MGKAILATALGAIIWWRGKKHMLAVMNYAMVCVVVFNMLVITYAL